MSTNNKEKKHYNQEVKRQAEFIKPPNTLKAKVGSGGISEAILNKAQELLESNSVDFLPLAELYLDSLNKGILLAQNNKDELDDEAIITRMIYPAMQLKANGGMFQYPLVTHIADKLIQFLEVIEEPDADAVELVMAFYTTIRAIVLARITGEGGEHGKELMDALVDACVRYFDKYPEQKTIEPQDFSEHF